MTTEATPTIEQALTKAQYDAPITLKEFFINAEVQAQQWAEKAQAIQIKDINDVEGMQQAKEARKEMRAIRLGVVKKHEEMKADALKKSQTLDLIKRTLIGFIEPIEAQLLEKENFAEVEESKRKLELYKKRIEALKPYRTQNDGLENIPLAEMNDDAFTALLSGLKAAHEKREADKKQKEEAEEFERGRKARLNGRLVKLMQLGFFYSEQYRSFIRGNNDPDAMNIGRDELETMPDEKFATTLNKFTELVHAQMEADKVKQQEAEKLAAKMLKEKQNAEAKLKAETAERKRLEAEAAERLQKVADEKKAKAAAERKAKRAPDKDKLLALADYIECTPLPQLGDDDAIRIKNATVLMLQKVVKYVRENSKNL